MEKEERGRERKIQLNTVESIYIFFSPLQLFLPVEGCWLNLDGYCDICSYLLRAVSELEVD